MVGWHHQLVGPGRCPWESMGDGGNINNLRYSDDTSLMAESEELKSLLMKVKEERKSWLKIQNSKN